MGYLETTTPAYAIDSPPLRRQNKPRPTTVAATPTARSSLQVRAKRIDDRHPLVVVATNIQPIPRIEQPKRLPAELPVDHGKIRLMTGLAAADGDESIRGEYELVDLVTELCGQVEEGFRRCLRHLGGWSGWVVVVQWMIWGRDLVATGETDEMVLTIDL